MKIALFLLSVAAVLLCASCGSPVARRIEKNPQVFQSLNEREKALVRRGQIEEGMGKDAVWLSWGKADRISGGSRMGKTYERWSYTGYEPVQGTAFGVGFGAGYSHHHPFAGCYYDPFFYAEPTVNYVPYEARHVEFVAGRVVGWAAGQSPRG